MKHKHNNIRTCIASRCSYDKAELFRFVVGEDSRLYFDYKKKLGGRGIWLYPTYNNLMLALNKNLFAKSCRSKVVFDKDDFYNKILTILMKELLNNIKLANKSGLCLYGFDAIVNELRTSASNVSLYVFSKEISLHTKQKVLQLIKHHEHVKVIDCFSEEELTVINTQKRVVQILIKKEKISEMISDIYEKIQNISC